ncbi:hypothetical protein BTUL_0005g01310 [Botrytis tulipae]|uniref:Rhodopsin domain-containing protein n=1 Tax=Botrytis tulipae TaxID=87230 RepID=A0A4Z1F8U5_9HELO|nr:hypothetical protein BTUL_0005g01310 [Botrytis tulipae]
MPYSSDRQSIEWRTYGTGSPKSLSQTPFAMVDTSLQDLALFIVAFSPALALITVCLRRRLMYNGNVGNSNVKSLTMPANKTAVDIIFNFVGLHIWDVPLDHDPIPGLKYNYAVQVLYNPILAIVKTSILMFFLRLAGQKIEVKLIFQCTPIAYNWQLDILGGSCIEQGTFYAATSVVALVTDILVLIVPFWIVIGLKMPRETKIAVIGIFFLGILLTIVWSDGIRLAMIVTVFFNPPPVDPTRGISFVTSAIEINLAIITASAPALKPVMRQWFPKLFGSSSDGAYNNQNSGPYVLQGNSRYERGTRNGAGFKSSRSSNGNGLIKL